MVHLNGVEGLRWGPGVWCVRVLIHGWWSGREDRNLEAVKEKALENCCWKKGKSCICYDLLVWALAELGQRWVVVAVSLGELRGFKKGPS